MVDFDEGFRDGGGLLGNESAAQLVYPKRGPGTGIIS